MSTTFVGSGLRWDNGAKNALKAAAWFWFTVAVIGQMVFALSIAAFYGRATARGDFGAWNKFMTHGYVSGHVTSNAAVGVHLAMAVFVTVAGALQLVSGVRSRAPLFHRWNGRVYMVAAYAISLAGLYMVWVRGAPGDVTQHLGLSLDAVLIMVFAALALRAALARDFRTHRRWALRLFLAVSGVWFIRIGFVLSFIVFKGPIGFNPRTFEGPFLIFMNFADYLLPLAILELYLRAQDGHSAPNRIAMATALALLTLVMGAGVAGATMGMWWPNIEAVAASRASAAETLSLTIATGGIDKAIEQYHRLKADPRGAVTFDEAAINGVGYQLIHTGMVEEAIRILQLNTEAYPKSGNAYDSLAEAYMDDGNKPQAVANYEKSIQLDPNNRNAVSALRELGAR